MAARQGQTLPPGPQAQVAPRADPGDASEHDRVVDVVVEQRATMSAMPTMSTVASSVWCRWGNPTAYTKCEPGGSGRQRGNCAGALRSTTEAVVAVMTPSHSASAGEPGRAGAAPWAPPGRLVRWAVDSTYARHVPGAARGARPDVQARTGAGGAARVMPPHGWPLAPLTDPPHTREVTGSIPVLPMAENPLTKRLLEDLGDCRVGRGSTGSRAGARGARPAARA